MVSLCMRLILIKDRDKIIVKTCKDGEKFVTLDGQVRKLDKDVLMICDAEKEIGIAGIMGGENSKITDDVKTILFEAATFNGPNIRKTAKRSDFVPMLPVSLKKDWIPEMRLMLLTVHASLLRSWVPVKL